MGLISPRETVGEWCGESLRVVTLALCTRMLLRTRLGQGEELLSRALGPSGS